jgi:hypothetical protein
MRGNAVRWASWVNLFGAAAVAAALGACAGGGRGDGGTDGGSPRTDGGPRVDGGSAADGGVGADGGGTGVCSSNQDCILAQRCNTTIGRCEADPGGTGTDCPNGQNDCAADGMTFCTGELPNSGPVCTRVCQSNAQCPREPNGTAWTCQAAFTTPDGGIFSACLAPNALGKPCRNETDTGVVDATWDCTEIGTFCLPDSQTSPTGRCVTGDNCNFPAQSGCNGTETCHPAGVFYFDNNQGTVCAPSGMGTQGAPCTTLNQCAKGYVCVGGGYGCLRYCVPGTQNACAGVTAPDGGTTSCIDILVDENGAPLPAAVRSIPVGVCF